jgi:acetyltransferase-like isoleucine patch superfamily enzyme
MLHRIIFKILYIFSSYENKALYYNIILAKKMGVRVGNDCRFYSINFSTEPYLIEIGNHVTITQNVNFSTHDGAVWVFRNQFPEIELFGRIKIGTNVFIGMNSTILFNTEIGDNSIVAAGSVVKGKFQSNSIIAGVPAKCIGKVEDYFLKNENSFTHFKNLSPSDKANKIKEIFN